MTIEKTPTPIKPKEEGSNGAPGFAWTGGIGCLLSIATSSIDERGKVIDVVPMAEKPFVDHIAIETIRGWEYEPARCGDTPVVTASSESDRQRCPMTISPRRSGKKKARWMTSALNRDPSLRWVDKRQQG